MSPRPRSNFLRRRSTADMGTHKTIAFLGLNVGGMMDRTLEKEIAENEEEQMPTDWFHRMRFRLSHVLHNKITLFIVVILCILDCALVIGGLLIELNVIKDMQVAINNHGEADHNKTDMDDHANKYSFLTKLAHAFHYASIAILAILLFETILKVFALGRKLLKHKFEIFDAIVTTVSFTLDLVYIDGTTGKSAIASAEALSIMLPWRVVRVVNSLVVALLLREHIKLLLMFKSKIYVQKQLNDVTEDLNVLTLQMGGVKELAISEGVADWKINQVIGKIFAENKKHKTDALRSMVSMAMSAATNNTRSLSNLFSMSVKRALNKKKSSASSVLASHSVDALSNPALCATDSREKRKLAVGAFAGHSIDALDNPGRSQIDCNHATPKSSTSTKATNIYDVLKEDINGDLGICNDAYEVNDNDPDSVVHRKYSNGGNVENVCSQKQRVKEVLRDKNTPVNDHKGDVGKRTDQLGESKLVLNKNRNDVPNQKTTALSTQHPNDPGSAITYINETSNSSYGDLPPAYDDCAKQFGRGNEMSNSQHECNSTPNNVHGDRLANGSVHDTENIKNITRL